MSNRVCLVATRFENLTPHGDVSYGFRIYDHYAAEYCNLMEEFEVRITDGELLHLVTINTNPIIDDMLEYATEHGMEINDTWYDADEIQRMLAE